MFLQDITIEPIGENLSRINAKVAGQEVWFELPTNHFRGSVADALTCFSFFPAMAQPADATPVTVEMPLDISVSKRLNEALPGQQQVFSAWASSLQRYNLLCTERSTATNDPRVMSSFSGGVDSLYTALTRSDEISHLVYIQGYELTLDKDPDSASLPRLQSVARELGKELIVVKTNALSVYRTLKIQRLLVCGAFMATIAHLLGPRRYYVPSSAPLSKLSNEGSHPLTDPRWSSEEVEIVYDVTNYDRIEKMRRVDEFGYMSGVLVCSRNFQDNCCRCIKCVRTMIGIELQGLSSTSFRQKLTPSLIRSLSPLDGQVDKELFGRYLTLARTLGRRDLVRAMAYCEAKYRLKSLVKDALMFIDNIVFGGMVSNRGNRSSSRDTRSAWFRILE